MAVIPKFVLTRLASRLMPGSGILRVEVRRPDLSPPGHRIVGFEVRLSTRGERHLVMVGDAGAVWSGAVELVGPSARSGPGRITGASVRVAAGEWLEPEAAWHHRVPLNEVELAAVIEHGGVQEIEILFGVFEHSVAVSVCGTRRVEIWPSCDETACESPHGIAPVVIAAEPDLIHDIALAQASALDDRPELDDDLRSDPSGWSVPGPLPHWREAPLEDWLFEELDDDEDVDDLPDGTERPTGDDGTPAPALANRLEGLADLMGPPAAWGPQLDVLRRALAAVAAGHDLLADLVDVDEFHVRGVARALLDGLDDLRVYEVPHPGQEREWIARRVEKMRVPDLDLSGRWATASKYDHDAAAMAVENATWVFCGQPVTGVEWCERAAQLLDASAADVPDSVRCRITDPLELIAVAAATLAVRGLAGEVPGTDVTGVDLWFATASAAAELAARGPILGRNEEGDVPAGGVVIVIGAEADRRSFIDALELAVPTGPSVRVGAAVPDGPHLAALSVARGVPPLVVNAPDVSSPFADVAHLPHLVPEPSAAEAAERIADRWTSLVAVGRDPWWEEQPRLYLPALLHALFLECPRGSIPAAAVVDAMQNSRLFELQHVCRRRGLDSVADRLAGLNGLDATGSTGLSLRITMNAAVPTDPSVHGRRLRPATLSREAVLLPPSATAANHAAIELAEAGCAVFWDDAHQATRPGSWLTTRRRGLTVVGYPTAATVKLPADTLRSATVIAYSGAGDLSEITGRPADPLGGEVAMLCNGTLTYLDPVDRVLARVVTDARRDALTRCTTAILAERFAA